MAAEIRGACPYCGSRRLALRPVWQRYRFVACLECRAAGPVAKTEREAVELFARRAQPEPEQPRLL